jgi:hypothetical protein
VGADEANGGGLLNYSGALGLAVLKLNGIGQTRVSVLLSTWVKAARYKLCVAGTPRIDD